MKSFPIFINLIHRPVIVIGGGDVALRKIEMLLRAGAKITVIASTLCKELKHYQKLKKIQVKIKSFEKNDLTNPVLVVAATNNKKVNLLVSKTAQALNIPVNVVDEPSLCSFTMGSIIDRSPLVIAISSEGNAPVLAKFVREKIEALIPHSFSKLASVMGLMRESVKNRYKTTQSRRIFWENLIDLPLVRQFLNQTKRLSVQQLMTLVKKNEIKNKQGEVFLVGGGPGDPDLLTFRALHLMQRSDVCVYDKLISKDVLNLVRRDAELIFVGKERDQHTMPQEKINQLLVKLAKKGMRVLRLKGGDPFIFGRGGEEIEMLMEHKIPFQVVPGITAANGVSSYAGIPLTHRDYAQSCIFVTGHMKNEKLSLEWNSLVKANQTVVVYMGLLALSQICEQFITHGASKNLPIAVVEQGTTSGQKVVTGSLLNITQKVKKEKLKSPSLIIIGNVVKLRKKLNWFN
jgi:uroporphyrin-III C-methyltransferase / precorrin-2 dehydrogenase / sirohydrochlorin ferrochelatase